MTAVENYMKGMEAVKAKRWSAAIEHLGNAARSGLKEAQFQYAELLDSGLGVPKTQGGALVWYKKSAQQGYPLAIHEVGRHYLYGLGVEVNKAEAVKWYKLAADTHYHDPSITALGICYYYGWGVARNGAKAVEYFKRTSFTDRFSMYYLARCHFEGFGTPQNNTAGNWVLTQSIDLGCSEAMNYLGDIYLEGKYGYCKDKLSARDMWRDAAKHGSNSAKQKLKQYFNE